MGMDAFEELEIGLICGLGTETDAVDAEFEECFEFGKVDGTGIGFGGDFFDLGGVERLVDGVEDEFVLGGGKKGGGASAKEDGFDDGFFGKCGDGLFDFITKMGDIARDERFFACCGGKVTIATSFFAKGDVNVYTGCGRGICVHLIYYNRFFS